MTWGAGGSYAPCATILLFLLALGAICRSDCLMHAGAPTEGAARGPGPSTLGPPPSPPPNAPCCCCRSGSRSSSYCLNQVGEALRLAFIGTSEPTPEPPPPVSTGGQWPPPCAVLQQNAAGQLPPSHVAYRVHVHMEKNKVGGGRWGWWGSAGWLLRDCFVQAPVALLPISCCPQTRFTSSPTAGGAGHPHALLLVLHPRPVHAAAHRDEGGWWSGVGWSGVGFGGAGRGGAGHVPAQL